ncbi:MAG TPA: HAMP domain-containing sensor histidine kinase [Candidatus Rubrimentiphilum sp.]|nr:HAMP domain-containing sensor histidine kinase [Candidatus Rubrimentiphilum sp.]
MIARLALRYLLVFAIVLALLSAGAYAFMSVQYQAMLLPAIGTPEAAAGYRTAMTRVLETIISFDVPLLALVGAASWLLARASLQPLIAGRQREREFAADAAHRLRSPLATIAAVSQAAKPGAPAELAQDFETITQAALDASQTVGELLTLSRPADSHLLQVEPVDIAVLAKNVSKEFEARAAERGLAIENRSKSAIVNGDELRLRELLRNLFENALRHARGRIVVDSHADGRTVDVTVFNDGDAVEDACREQIFERAFSGDSRGSGLGLALVRWIARAHQGEAFVRDGKAGGAEFVVRLPRLQE